MPSPEKRTVSLTAEHNRYIEDKVASGAFATASEVVRAGLQALQEREDAIERWLSEEVVPAAAAMQADPGRGIPAGHILPRLRARNAERLKTERGA